MTRSVEDDNRRMLRARDAMDRDFALPLDVPTLASVAAVSQAHFIRSFRATFGETPHRYLQRRRIERLDLDDGSFDAVMAIDVVLHVRDRRDLFRELARVLVPGDASCSPMQASSPARYRTTTFA